MCRGPCYPDGRTFWPEHTAILRSDPGPCKPSLGQGVKRFRRLVWLIGRRNSILARRVWLTGRMDFKKVLDQTVREIKREVNKKVLKLPEIEQKVLDATSNEPWGPHGTLMGEIAQSTRNFNECQMIMNILWKRLNDSGRNWRHVYKALTVLEYLVANGSERVVDELREHSFQISTLLDFQYVEPSGKDQGINVRKKAQNIVSLINDKERMQEVREKAAANRDKYRGMSSTGEMYKPSPYSSTGGGYDDDYYDEDRHRYGQGRDRYRDRYRDERSGKDGDWQIQDGDRYGKDGGNRYRRNGDRYRDDDFGGDRDHEDERQNYKRGDRRYDKERDRVYDDDDRYSSRSGGGRGDDYALDERRHAQKQSRELSGAPPSYDESISKSGHRYTDERVGGGLAATVAKTSTQATSGQSQGADASLQNVATSSRNVDDDFDDFDPRGLSAVGVTAPFVAFTDDDFFGQTSAGGLSDANRTLPPPPSAATVVSTSATVNVPSTGVDLFADASFNSSFMDPPVFASISQSKLNGDHFGGTSFKASFSSSEDLFAAQASNSFEGNSSSAFGTTIQPVQASEPPNLFQTQAQPSVPEVTQESAMAQQQTLHEEIWGQNSNARVPSKSQQNKDKFEPKSGIWADTLSRGLIDLNISGPKGSSLADIGIDLSSIAKLEGRKEEEKKISTVSMGKAMGTGSGLGRAGASTLAPPSASPMMGLMSMGGYGMGAGTGAGAGMQTMMGPGMGITPGMGMPGMGMSPAMSMPPAPSMGVGMNSMMGAGQGGFANPQQQYGGFR